ncbi:hypothetical protein SmJEL517_g05414 [Synchytrium microbalum]|uniref:Enoyl-CoA hydratase n=1 Tax=Synchytrium microbalum TaxID=1806994 RepID=A0A507BLB4_9FUNG|nr:uncharacterized protein SmJEL517_g05414 [Synchytrium microbalum]TPX31170.1 hypothetical protein SmJEL517_g05414 [Synchytrium microbalum]
MASSRIDLVRAHFSAAAAETQVPTQNLAAAAQEEPYLKVVRDEVNGKPTGVVILSFNRPKTLNHMSVEMGEAVVDFVNKAKNDSTIRCVILTGEGRAFSAGGDVRGMLQRTLEPPAANHSENQAQFYGRFLSIRQLPVPVIAAINGPAAGAGLSVALACDMRLVAEDAKIGVTFVRIGLHPGMGCTHTLLKIVGHQNAARLLLTGDTITGKEAKELGIVLAAVPKEKLIEESLKLARRVATASPIAVRQATLSIRKQTDEGLERALLREADNQALNNVLPDLKEGLDAVINKREPVFRNIGDYN